MADKLPGARVYEQPLTAQINLRGRENDADFLQKMLSFLGQGLPEKCGQVQECVVDIAAAQVGFKIFWMAPDEWLIVADFDHRKAILDGLNAGLAGSHYALTDLSANRRIITLEGEGALKILKQGCSLDMGAALPAPAGAVQTRFARTRVILERVNDRSLFQLYVRNSFSEYLLDWLAVTVAE